MKIAHSSVWLCARFSLDLDIAAPKITIPTDFCPDNTHATKLLLDLGNLLVRTQVGTHDGIIIIMLLLIRIHLIFYKL